MSRNGRPRLVTVADLAAEQESLAILLQAMAKIPGRRACRRAARPARTCAATCPTGASPSLSTSACTAGSSAAISRPAARPACAAVPPLLRSADLMVNLNQHEASALTSIQAMACGTPVVAAANGPHLDASIDGTTGIHVQPLRPALLAQKIRALLAHPMQLEAFSVAATDRARSRYSWDRIAHETLAVYDTALAA